MNDAGRNDTGRNDDSRKKIIAGIKLALLAAILIGVPVLLYMRYGAGIFSKDTADSIIAYLKKNPDVSALGIIGIQILQVVICIIPGQPIQVASSYMFGVFGGFILSIIGAVIGTVISFYLAKLLGRDAVELLFGKDKVGNYHDKLNSGRGLMIVLLIYLIPGFPKDLVSYVAGISDMKLRPFLLVSTIGRSPGMLGSLLFGYFAGKENYTAVIILAAAVTVTLIVCVVYRKRLLSLLDDLEAREEQREKKVNG